MLCSGRPTLSKFRSGMTLFLAMPRTRSRSPTGFIPVGNGCFNEPGFRIMLCQQLRLGVDQLGGLRFKRFRNPQAALRLAVGQFLPPRLQALGSLSTASHNCCNTDLQSPTTGMSMLRPDTPIASADPPARRFTRRTRRSYWPLKPREVRVAEGWPQTPRGLRGP